MICPKCRGNLRTVDRAGIHLEQCESCRGIFLDHGELEQLLGAAQRYYGGAPGGYRDSPRPHGGGYRDSPRPYGGGHRDSPRPYGGGHGGYRDSPRPYGGHGHRRKGGFLGELFG